eukprot:4102343-Alexandrium_andersonii.AAC.1
MHMIHRIASAPPGRGGGARPLWKSFAFSIADKVSVRESLRIAVAASTVAFAVVVATIVICAVARRSV